VAAEGGERRAGYELGGEVEGTVVEAGQVAEHRRPAPHERAAGGTAAIRLHGVHEPPGTSLRGQQALGRTDDHFRPRVPGDVTDRGRGDQPLIVVVAAALLLGLADQGLRRRDPHRPAG